MRPNAAVCAIVAFLAVGLPSAGAVAQPGAAVANMTPILAAINSVMRVVASRPGGTTDSGTGFIARSLPTGQLILTAYHVVRGASAVRVSGGTLQLASISARVVAGDQAADVAVLIVPGVYIAHPLPLGDAMSVTPGQPVYVLGFPRPESLGDTRATFTGGTVSAVLLGLIQMQAPISSGNSGGPVLTQRGDVVALVTGVLTESKQLVTQQINFATWINAALPMLDTARAGSRASQPHAFTLAAGSGDQAVCAQAGTATLNSRDDLGELPLVEAAKGAHQEIVQCLLGNGADPNAAESDGTTPLLATAEIVGRCPQPSRSAVAACLAAFQLRTVQIAQTLLHAGALVNVRDAAGASPLERAILSGNGRLAELFMDAHANPNLRDKVLGATALMYAAQRGYEPMVARLVSRSGAAVNLQDSDGRTALDYAVLGGDLPTIHTLTSAGASAAVRDHGGQTPLWYAARVLLSKLSLTQSTQPSEVTTLLNAAAHGELAKVEALAGCGAAVACASTQAPLAPRVAGALRWYRAVAVLLETHGASVWLGAGGAATRAMQAVWEDRLNVILDPKTDIAALNAQDAEGWSPLMAAVWRGGLAGRMVKALLDRHADPATVNDLGRTPLMYAAARGDLVVVQMLLDGGVSPLTQDFEGHNAAWYAMCYRKGGAPAAARVLGVLQTVPPKCS
ncbi:MAG TPA: ankyrin repeat domain-containing protein [bacterium]|nr:ankyrin repeat domain-containing protein [bacterium]